MKRHLVSGAGTSPRGNCLGHTCGTNIDTEGIEFTNQQPNLLYIDKVFSFNKDTASPILFNLNTGGSNTNNFITELFLDGRGPFPCTLASNAVFEIDNSFVVVEYFNTRPPGNINASQVTLDGFPVDFVSYANGQYTARTANVLPRIQKERCLDRGLPTKAFFLISDSGPWDFRATFVLEGTVNTNGRLCRFRAEITNAPNSMNISLPNSNLSSFAVRNLSLPCSINGIAPDVLFQFSAKVNLVNPRLIANCGILPPPAPLAATESTTAVDEQGLLPSCPDIGPIFTNSCTVSLISTVAVEPVVHVQTVRKTLFCVNACEALQPCQGSVAAAEIEDDNEDCSIGGVDRPDCRCRRDEAVGGVTGCREFLREDDFVGGDNTFVRNPTLGLAGCGTQEIPAGVGGEVTVGTGTCEDCVWGRPTRPCRQCRGSREDVQGISGRGSIRKHFRGDEFNELFEEEEEEVLGLSQRVRLSPRTSFQFNGCNGCSW